MLVKEKPQRLMRQRARRRKVKVKEKPQVVVVVVQTLSQIHIFRKYIKHHSDSPSAADGDNDNDDLEVKWNSFFFDLALSDDLPSFLADTRAFFLRPFLAALPVLPSDNPVTAMIQQTAD